MALGASPINVIVAVSRQGASPAMIGLAFGLVAALGGARWLASSIYGVGAIEPALIVSVLGVTTIVSLAATVLAARRALSIQPIEAMRGS